MLLNVPAAIPALVIRLPQNPQLVPLPEKILAVIKNNAPRAKLPRLSLRKRHRHPCNECARLLIANLNKLFRKWRFLRFLLIFISEERQWLQVLAMRAGDEELLLIPAEIPLVNRPLLPLRF